MKNNHEQTFVPKLRFPEFEDGGEWEEKVVGEFIKERTEIVEEKLPLYSLTIEDGVIPKSERYERSFLVKDEENAYKAVHYGDFAYNPMNLRFGAIARYTGKNKIALSKYYNIFYCNSLVDSAFCSVIFRLSTMISRYNDIATGTLIEKRRVHFGSFLNLKILLPSLPEQQKIAACLSSLDDLISAENHKLDALTAHKKGLLQHLFPAEGETVPKLRFKEFEDSGEWEEKLVEDYFTVGSSKRVLQQDWTNQGVPFYRTRELVSLSKNEHFGSEVFISEELFSELQQRYGTPTEGDFLVSGVGTLGVCYQVQEKDKFYFKDGNVLWFKLENELHSTYFKYCFLSDHIQNQINGQTSKSTVGTYTIQNAKKTKFWHPSTYQEQQKIAACLSSLDDLISAQRRKVEALKVHKKGLMQGLFPDGQGE